jgi:translation elongation factor EF-1beta
MYTNIQQAISAVESAYPSLFTKEDVIKLLNSIDLESASAPSKDGIDVDELVDRVQTLIGNYDSSDIVDYEDVSFSLNYDNRIELDSVNVDLDDLNSDVTATIYEFFKKTAK